MESATVRQEVFLSKDIVWCNMPDSHSRTPPSKYESFFDYWLVNIATNHSYALERGYHRVCHNEFCESLSPNDIVGAHIAYSDAGTGIIGVAPLCRDCDHPTNGQLIKLPNDMPVVRAPITIREGEAA